MSSLNQIRYWTTAAFIVVCFNAHGASLSVNNEMFINSLSGWNSGSIANSSTAGYTLDAFSFSFGAPESGIAAWDLDIGLDRTAGGTASNCLVPRVCQTITWTGLALSPGQSFSWSGLDVETLVTVSPLLAIGEPGALTNAQLTYWFDSGDVLTGAPPLDLSSTTTFVVSGHTVVPIPAAAWLFASALGVFAYMGKRKQTA